MFIFDHEFKSIGLFIWYAYLIPLFLVLGTVYLIEFIDIDWAIPLTLIGLEYHIKYKKKNDDSRLVNQEGENP